MHVDPAVIGQAQRGVSRTTFNSNAARLARASGSLPATIKAVETVDACLARVVKSAEYPFALIPHPVANNDDAALRAKAEIALREKGAAGDGSGRRLGFRPRTSAGHGNGDY